MSSASGIRAGRAFVEIGANSAPLQAALLRVKGQLASMAGAIAKVGGSMIAAGAGVAAALAWPLKLASDLEQTKASFETMLKSAEKANSLMKSLRQFAASTPFEFPDIADAAKKLLAFGSAASDVEAELGVLGDLASGIGIPLGDLAEIYGKARVQGRLFAEDINQLTGRGIPIIGKLAQQFGVTEGEVRGLVESGKIGFDQLQKALVDLTTGTGQFAGAMEKQSKTLAGRWSTLKDTIAEAVLPLGETILPYVSQSIAALTVVIGNMGSAWEVVVALTELRFAQFMASNLEWINKFKDGWTTASAWIAQVGVVAFSGLESAWDSVATSIISAVDWIWSKLKMLLELLQVAGEELGLLDTAQSNQGKSVGDRLGAIEKERQANAKARDDDYNRRAANRAKDTDAMLKSIQQQADYEKEARAKALTDSQKKALENLSAAKKRFDELVDGASNSEVEKKRRGLIEKASVSLKAASGSSFGAFNASLVMQQVQQGKSQQDQIVKNGELQLAELRKLNDKEAGGIALA